MPITKASGQAVAPAAKGDLVVGSATNDAAVLGVGTTDQVLTVDSSTTTGLKWATPVSGAITLISEQTPSGASSVTFGSIPGTYKQLFFVWQGLYLSTGSTQWRIRLNNSSSSVYAEMLIAAQGGTVSAQAGLNTAVGGGLLLVENVTSGTEDKLSKGSLLIDNYASTTRNKNYYYQNGFQRTGTGDNFGGMVIGTFQSTSAITSIDLVRTSGTGTLSLTGSNSIRLYGIS